MSYRVILPKPVQKQLEKLPQPLQDRVLDWIAALAETPRPTGCVKLKGRSNEFRIRIGDYRVRYEVDDQVLVILLLDCRDRKEVYRRRRRA